ncbi:MAG: dihydroneopterin aldolase [Candidatus Eisenbacteria sp.]|nr:dihydroneopterin aldolase [Candidatus Eisenbacteria bacterium]
MGTMDVIRLKEITVFPLLGVGVLEKAWVQKVTLDIELHLDLSKAGLSDAIEDTIDYQRIYELVREVSEERKYHLVETLAHQIAAAIRAHHSVERIVVRVRKLSLPFDAHLNCVEIEISEPGRLPDGISSPSE